MIKLSELKRKEIRKIIKLENGENIIIKNPNKKQRQEITKLLIKSTQFKDENGQVKVVTGLTNEDFLYYMVRDLVEGIELDLENNLHREEIKQIFDDADTILSQVLYELEKIHAEIIREYLQILTDIKEDDYDEDIVSLLLNKQSESEKDRESIDNLMRELLLLQEKTNELVVNEEESKNA